MASPPPPAGVEERAIDADRHESWLGLRSELTHATEEGDALAPAGTHDSIVRSLVQEPKNSAEAVAWLANHLNGRGLSLRRGHLVATGQTCNTKACHVGDRVVATFHGLGRGGGEEHTVEMVIRP